MVQVRKNISRCGRTLWRELQFAVPRQAEGARCLSEGFSDSLFLSLPPALLPSPSCSSSCSSFSLSLSLALALFLSFLSLSLSLSSIEVRL
jgi:hypothetical protein